MPSIFYDELREVADEIDADSTEYDSELSDRIDKLANARPRTRSDQEVADKLTERNNTVNQATDLQSGPGGIDATQGAIDLVTLAKQQKEDQIIDLQRQLQEALHTSSGPSIDSQITTLRGRLTNAGHYLTDASLNRDGTVESTAAYNSWIQGVPSGITNTTGHFIHFWKNSTIWADKTIVLGKRPAESSQRHDIHIMMHGATIQQTPYIQLTGVVAHNGTPTLDVSISSGTATKLIGRQISCEDHAIPDGTIVTNATTTHITMNVNATANATISPVWFVTGIGTPAQNYARTKVIFNFVGAVDCDINDGALVGSAPAKTSGATPDDNVLIYDTKLEGQHGVQFSGAIDCVVNNMMITQVWGDWVYWTSNGNTNNSGCKALQVIGSYCARMGFSPVKAQNFEIGYCTGDLITRKFIDMEPDSYDWLVDHGWIHNNNIGYCGLGTIAADAVGLVNNITIEDNVSTYFLDLLVQAGAYLGFFYVTGCTWSSGSTTINCTDNLKLSKTDGGRVRPLTGRQIAPGGPSTFPTNATVTAAVAGSGHFTISTPTTGAQASPVTLQFRAAANIADARTNWIVRRNTWLQPPIHSAALAQGYMNGMNNVTITDNVGPTALGANGVRDLYWIRNNFSGARPGLAVLGNIVVARNSVRNSKAPVSFNGIDYGKVVYGFVTAGTLSSTVPPVESALNASLNASRVFISGIPQTLSNSNYNYLKNRSDKPLILLNVTPSQNNAFGASPSAVMDSIISGARDSYLTTTAQNYQAQALTLPGQTLYLSIEAEPEQGFPRPTITTTHDHDYYANLINVRGYSANQFVAAFRKIVTVFRAAGADNVRFMYCTTCTDEQNRFVYFYPGDAYVDDIGVDPYHIVTGSESKGMAADVDANYVASFARQHSKPFYVPEFGFVDLDTGGVTVTANALIDFGVWAANNNVQAAVYYYANDPSFADTSLKNAGPKTELSNLLIS